MQIQQLMDKAEYGQYQILNFLYSKKTAVSIKDLAISTDLSRATLIKYIESINLTMRDHSLMCSVNLNLDEVSLFLGDHITWNEVIAVFLKNSPKYQILLYLFKKHEFTIPELAQYLLISEATLNRHISGLNKSLSEFKVSVSQGRLSGEELDIRHLYFELFWQIFTKEELEKHLEKYDRQEFINIVESLTNKELNLEQRYKLQLWISISQQRMKFSRKKFKILTDKMSNYEGNVFLNRLERASLNYFNSNKYETMSLFAFLTSHFILPIQTMEYILGFGGPVSEEITQAIRLKRKAGLVSEIAHEKVIYVLGQLFCQCYFFNGALILYPKSNSLLKDVTSEHDTLIQDLKDLLFISPQSQAIEEKVETELRKLMIFAKEKRKQSLKVAIDIEDNSLNQELWIRVLKEELNNNKMIELLSIKEYDDYDCVVSDFVHNDYGKIPVYRIKQGLSSRDLTSIAIFLEKQLMLKNKE